MNCPSFENCEAMLCPLDKDIKLRVWYPDEPICGRKDYQNIEWLKKQKEIAKKVLVKGNYFNLEIIQAIKKIDLLTEGINPNIIDGKRVEDYGNQKTLKKNDLM